MSTRFVTTFVSSLLVALALPVPLASAQGSPAEMKEFFLGLIGRGPAYDTLPAAEASIAMRGHFSNMERLIERGELVLAGPLGGHEDLAGLFVFDVATQGEAETLAASDPAVAAGRFSVDVLSFWAPVTLSEILPLHRARFPKDDDVVSKPVDDGNGQGTASRPGSTAPTNSDDAVLGAPSLGDVADSYLAAYVAGDFDALSALLTDDAVFEDPSMQLSGRAAVVTGLGQAFTSMTITAYEPTSRLVSGNEHVLVDGRVRFEQEASVLGLSGGPLQFDLRMAVSLRMRGGKVARHVDVVDSEAYAAQLQAQLADRG